MDAVDLSALRFNDLLDREWLATNAVGGLASSTIPCLNSRKYHGLLIAAMTPPARPMVLLSRVEETLICGTRSYSLACNEYPGIIDPQGHRYLRAFNAQPFPRWAYQESPWAVEKSLRLLRGENTVCLTYTLLGGCDPVRLELRALFGLRGVHDLMYQWNGPLTVEDQPDGQSHRITPTSRTPEVFFAHDGEFFPQSYWYLNTIYRREQERGYAGLEDTWTPGVVHWTLKPGQPVHFICSADPIDLDRVLSEAARQYAPAPPPAVAESLPDTALQALVRAADQFVVTTRQQPAQIVTGYPWGAISGRDAMIALPGLLLVTGRLEEAKALLLHYARHMRRGLIPSGWSDDGSAPHYLAADASLWFINAVHRYLTYGGDDKFVQRSLLEPIDQIIQHYQFGTDLGIHMEASGLVTSRQPAAPTTWMDAQLGDWVVTPRQGRTVELNALWYNALCIAAQLAEQFHHAVRSRELQVLAQKAKTSFNARFWNDAAHCCYDVLDDHGHDPALRPNQVLAVSLPHPVLAIERHAEVLEKLRAELLTPFGLRTLSPHDPGYHGRYTGGVVERDRAYHQGSAYPWLLGPMGSAWLRVYGRSKATRTQVAQMLQGCVDHMESRGMGQICELFDGETPHAPGGLPASARSVAEILRCYVEDVLDLPAIPRTAAPSVTGPSPAFKVNPSHRN